MKTIQEQLEDFATKKLLHKYLAKLGAKGGSANTPAQQEARVKNAATARASKQK